MWTTAPKTTNITTTFKLSQVKIQVETQLQTKHPTHKRFDIIITTQKKRQNQPDMTESRVVVVATTKTGKLLSNPRFREKPQPHKTHKSAKKKKSK